MVESARPEPENAGADIEPPQPAPVATAPDARHMIAANITLLDERPSAPPPSEVPKLAERVEKLEHFHTQVKLALALVAFVGVGGIVEGILSDRWTTFQDKLEKASVSGAHAESALNYLVTHQLSELRVELCSVVENIAQHVRDQELEHRLTSGENRLKTLQGFATLAETTRTEVAELLAVYSAARRYGTALGAKDERSPGAIASVRHSIREWTNLSTNKIAFQNTPECNPFEAYRLHTLGSLELRLAQATRVEGQMPDFSIAKERLNNVLILAPEFAKAHMNLGVIAKREWLAGEQKDVVLLDQARRLYERALEHGVSNERTQGSANNNLADIQLHMAAWYAKTGKLEQAKGSVADARRRIEEELKRESPSPTSYVTRAEIACLAMRVDAVVFGETPATALDWIRRAIERNYVRLSGLKPSEIGAFAPSLVDCGGDKEFLAKVVKLAR